LGLGLAAAFLFRFRNGSGFHGFRLSVGVCFFRGQVHFLVLIFAATTPKAADQKQHADPRREHHRRFTQRVIAPVTGQYGRNHVRNVDFVNAALQVFGFDVQLRGRVRIAETGHVQRAIGQSATGDDADDQCREVKA